MPGSRRQFDFINITAPTEIHDARYRKEVHLLSMRAFRRRERLERIREHDRRRGSKEASSETSQRKPAADEAARAVLRSPSQRIGIGMVDPFASSSLPLSSQHQALLTHFVTVIGFTLRPCQPATTTSGWAAQWLRFALCDPLVLSAVCMHSAVDRQSRGAIDSLSIFYFRNIVITGVRDALKDSTSMPEDSAIAAVGFLAADMLVTGDLDQLHTHMQALKRLISMRGGSDKLGFDGLLKRSAEWHHPSSTILLHSRHPGKVEESSSNLATCRLPFRDIERLFQECRRLVAEMECFERCSSVSCDNIMTFSESRSALEHDLIAVWKASKRAKVVDLQHAACAGALTAALVLDFAYLRRFLPRNPIFPILRDDMSQSLECVSRFTIGHFLSSQQAKYVLWTVAVALWAGVSSHTPTVFDRLVQLSMRKLHISSAQDVKAVLKQCAWTDSVWTAAFDSLIDGRIDASIADA